MTEGYPSIPREPIYKDERAEIATRINRLWDTRPADSDPIAPFSSSELAKVGLELGPFGVRLAGSR